MTTTYVDSRLESLAAVAASEGNRALCYDQQAAYVESLLAPGMVVLDVGCGPSLPYQTPAKIWVIGLDPSAAALGANRDIDSGILGSAEQIALDDATVDVVVAFYSLHHMTAGSGRETDLLRLRAFREMARVLRPGGSLLVVEMAPHRWAALLQRWCWNAARRLLGQRLDALFFTPFEHAIFGATAGLGTPRIATFVCSPLETIAPVFALPSLRIPRCLYPFDAVLLHWRKGVC